MSSNREKILNGFYGFLILALLSGAGSMFSGVLSWGFGVNSRLEAQAAEAAVVKQEADDHWDAVKQRLDSIDTRLSNIDHKLDREKHP